MTHLRLMCLMGQIIASIILTINPAIVGGYIQNRVVLLRKPNTVLTSNPSAYCKYPNCGCVPRLGCALEPYDMKEPHNVLELTDADLPCPFDEVFGG